MSQLCIHNACVWSHTFILAKRTAIPSLVFLFKTKAVSEIWLPIINLFGHTFSWICYVKQKFPLEWSRGVKMNQCNTLGAWGCVYVGLHLGLKKLWLLSRFCHDSGKEIVLNKWISDKNNQMRIWNEPWKTPSLAEYLRLYLPLPNERPEMYNKMRLNCVWKPRLWKENWHTHCRLKLDHREHMSVMWVIEKICGFYLIRPVS